MGDFWTGVAVGVTVMAIGWIATWANGLRKEHRQAAAAEYERRAPIRVGGHIVATELQTNAELAARWESSRVPHELRLLETQEWRQRRGEMAPLRDEDARLWEDLELTYAQLERSKRDTAGPPTSTS